MVNAQKWLDDNYPKKERNSKTEVDLTELLENKAEEIRGQQEEESKEIELELNLEDFKELEEIRISHYVDEVKTFNSKIEEIFDSFTFFTSPLLDNKSKIKIKNVKKGVRVVRKAQKWLESKYKEVEERAQITELNLSNQNLKGDLDLSYFTSLEKLTITGNPYLKEIKGKNSETTIIRWNNIQEWFDNKYPNKKNEAVAINIEETDNSDKNNEKIEVIDFTDLKELEFNKDSELKIVGFDDLTEIKKCDRDFFKFLY